MRVDDVVQRAVPLEVAAIGNVRASSFVEVKSQVEGQVARILFTEGGYVTKGSPLFTIDPRPFTERVREAEARLQKDRAAVEQVKANLERDQAMASNAKVQVNRYAELLEKGFTSKQQFDDSKTNFDALKAAVKADQAALSNAQALVQADGAALENARIELGYTEIRSPLTGRTGNLLIHRGNVVKANDTVLVRINQLEPIFVDFSVPEQYLSRIRKYRAQKTLPVRISIPGDSEESISARLTFVNNEVDTQTGTIQLKATTDNRAHRLWPGQFVNVVLTLTIQPDAILVPSQAVQVGQNGQFVFVVRPDLTVELRPVTVGREIGEAVLVQSGLKAGEKVVTDGQLRLFPGAKVRIQGAAASDSGASS